MYDSSNSKTPFAERPVDYRAIFNKRGETYHRAMLEFPEARNQEFREIVRLVNLKPGEVLCDAPSGGGYLLPYLPFANCEVIALETSETFYRLCERRGGCRAIFTQLEQIDLPDASVDCVVTLAGLHHLPDRAAFFHEAFRIVKPGGSCCVAEVAADSSVARFLNGFVDRFNSLGHKGDFLDANAPSELESAGFAVTEHYCRDYHWTFASVDDMVRFVTLLFGLDRAGPEEVREGVASDLGYEAGENHCRMNWGLRFMRGIK